jgi:hypothetical protein
LIEFQIRKYKIPSSKHQITNKSQFFNDQNKFDILNFGHCDLFDIWDLRIMVLEIFPTKELNGTKI